MVEPARVRAGSSIDLGDVSSQALAVFARRWIAACGLILVEFSLIAGVAAILPFAAQIFAVAAGLDRIAVLRSAGFNGAFVGIVLVAAIGATAVAHAAIALMAFRDATGRATSFATALASALARSPSSIVATLLSWLCLTLGLTALVVPGLIVASLFAVAIPAGVVEGLGPLASLARSAALTRGDRWRVLGFLLVVDLGLGLANLFLVRLVYAVSTPGLSALFFFLLALLVGALGQIALGVLYVHLRAAREGVDVEWIASVFD